MMGGEHGKDELQKIAGIILLPVFIWGLVWTFVSFKKGKQHLLDKEMEKLRDGIFQELRKVLADIIREEQGLLKVSFSNKPPAIWGSKSSSRFNNLTN